jgi:hypothetical protein
VACTPKMSSAKPTPSSLFQEGKSLAAAGDRRGAVRLFIAAAEMGHPQPSLCHHAVGALLQREGLHHAALAQFAAAVRLEPRGNHLGLASLSQAHRAVGQLVPAVAALRQCLRLMPGSAAYGQALRQAESLCGRVERGQVLLMWCVARVTVWRHIQMVDSGGAEAGQGGAEAGEESRRRRAVGELLPGEAVVVVGQRLVPGRKVAGRRQGRVVVRCENPDGWVAAAAADGSPLLVGRKEHSRCHHICSAPVAIRCAAAPGVASRSRLALHTLRTILTTAVPLQGKAGRRLGSGGGVRRGRAAASARVARGPEAGCGARAL